MDGHYLRKYTLIIHTLSNHETKRYRLPCDIYRLGPPHRMAFKCLRNYIFAIINIKRFNPSYTNLRYSRWCLSNDLIFTYGLHVLFDISASFLYIRTLKINL
jgi:hypothetical protein